MLASRLVWSCVAAVGFLAAPLLAWAAVGTQVPQGAYDMAGQAPTGPTTGTAGFGSATANQKGGFHDSSGNKWNLRWVPELCRYVIVHAGVLVGTMEISRVPPGPPFMFTVFNTANMQFSTGTFTPIP